MTVLIIINIFSIAGCCKLNVAEKSDKCIAVSYTDKGKEYCIDLSRLQTTKDKGCDCAKTKGEHPVIFFFFFFAVQKRKVKEFIKGHHDIKIKIF